MKWLIAALLFNVVAGFCFGWHYVPQSNAEWVCVVIETVMITIGIMKMIPIIQNEYNNMKSQ